MSKAGHGAAGVRLNLPVEGLTEDELFRRNDLRPWGCHNSRGGGDFEGQQQRILIRIFGQKEMERYEADKGRRDYVRGRRDEGGKIRAANGCHKGDVPE